MKDHVENNEENLSHPEAKPSKGKGDPVQKSAREARIKQSLRENLLRRKAKARGLKAQDKS